MTEASRTITLLLRTINFFPVKVAIDFFREAACAEVRRLMLMSVGLTVGSENLISAYTAVAAVVCAWVAQCRERLWLIEIIKAVIKIIPSRLISASLLD
ncbi:MAG: hypothetical protein Q8N85_01010 [Candidatus Omnitrophota bacterium]|nr:hypothetical protein [Candidatus Omnitrophota bacterium]